MKDKEKTERILNILHTYYQTWSRERTNVIFPELRLGSGYCGVSQRRVDMFIISSNDGNVTTAFEIKVSRQDFKNDLNNDLKQRGARLYSNYFYYVTPPGLLSPNEVPLYAGLLEVDLTTRQINNPVPAPLHSRIQPSWGLICSLIRHINKSLYTERINELQKHILALENELNSKNRLISQLADENLNEETRKLITRVNKLKW